MTNEERAAMEARAQRWATNDDVRQYADFATFEVLLALRECTKLVCPLCRSGLVSANGHHYGETRIYVCTAAPIHAKIAELQGEKP